MSYIAHTWTANEVVTAEKLNALENGIANCNGGTLIVNLVSQTDTDWYYDTTANDIITTFINGGNVIIDGFSVVSILHVDDGYRIYWDGMTEIADADINKTLHLHASKLV